MSGATSQAASTAEAAAQPALPAAAPSVPTSPGLWKRLACMLYEGVLLFGVVMIAGLVFSGLTQQRNAMSGRHELQAFLFVVLGIYFVWFWSHGGQTVAMKTWHIRLVRRDGQPVSQVRALARYVLSWVWFIPVLGVLYVHPVASAGLIFAAMAGWVLVYAWAARLHSTGQYWHDIVCGTQLIVQQPPLKAKKVRAKVVG